MCLGSSTYQRAGGGRADAGEEDLFCAGAVGLQAFFRGGEVGIVAEISFGDGDVEFEGARRFRRRRRGRSSR